MVFDDAWRALDTIHCVVYNRHNHEQDYEQLGLDDPWQTYLASRAAALGPVSAEVATALFYGFAPDRLSQHLPGAWDVASPSEILQARSAIAARALEPFEDQLQELAPTLIEVLARLDLAGTPMAAAQIALETPTTPALQVWHAATALREYRGDRHWSVLATAGINGASANALAVATGRQKPSQQARTGWDDHTWSQAFDGLKARGWVDDEHNATPEGISARNQLEDVTSRVTVAGLDDEARARLLAAESQLVTLAGKLTA